MKLLLAAAALFAAALWLREPALAWLALLGAPAAALVLSLAAHRERRRRLAALLEPGLGAWGRPDRVDFGSPDRARWPDRELSWAPGLRGRAGETEARIALAAPVRGLLAVSTPELGRLAGSLGGPPARLGEPAFDPAFRVRGSPEDLAPRLLDPEARRVLLELKALLAPAPFEVTIGGRELAFYAPAEILEPGRLAGLAERLARLAAAVKP